MTAQMSTEVEEAPPMAGSTRGSRGKPGGETPPTGGGKKETGRVTIASIDADVLGETKGFLLFLAQEGGVDGMSTIGDVVARALTTGENLQVWRQKYNKGKPFRHAAFVPSGRK
jgi:hypothetical protein